MPCKVDWSHVAFPVWCEAPIASCRHQLPNDAGVPAVSKRFFSRQSSLLKELDAPSSVAEFANVQAKLESDTKDKDAHKMEGGCLREFTRFLEKEVPHRQAHMRCTRHSLGSMSSHHCCVSLAGPGAQVGRPAAGAAHRGPVGVVLQGLHRHHQGGH